MMTVNILCVGKLKEKYWKDACAEYAKRLTPYCKFSIIEVDEYKVPSNPSDTDIKNAVDEEGKRLISKLNMDSKVISLCIEGKILSSEELSNTIQNYAVLGSSKVTFVIGGSWGLSNQIKDMSSIKLSISRMTLPHQLARVLMCEQIYRAFQISSSGKYHK